MNYLHSRKTYSTRKMQMKAINNVTYLVTGFCIKVQRTLKSTLKSCTSWGLWSESEENVLNQQNKLHKH